MKPQILPHHHIIRPPKEEIKNPKPLFMLHGYGSNENDLFSFCEYLPENLFVISLRAPHALGMGSYHWYDIYHNNNGKHSDNQQAIAARDGILCSINMACKKYLLNEKSISIMGFSQGAILGYALCLSFPERFKNLIGLSGYINSEIVEGSSEKKDISHLNIYASHGMADNVIPYSLAQETKNALEKTDAKFVFETYPEGHTVSPENFQSLCKWADSHLVPS